MRHWKPASLLLVGTLLSAGCIMPLGGKTKHSTHSTQDESEEEDDANPQSLRKHMHEPTHEPDPWNISKWLKDERTMEIERNLGVE